MASRLRAWLLLGGSMARQLGAAPFRRLRRGTGARDFLGAVQPEGYIPLTADERATFPSFMRCIGCGLCSAVCPVLRETPQHAWRETWTFVAGPSRMLDRATLAARSLEPCARCGACAAACPTGVPIPRLAALVHRLAGAASEAHL